MDQGGEDGRSAPEKWSIRSNGDGTVERAHKARPGMHPDDRFLMKVDFQVGGCWEWLASRTNGYGMFALSASKNMPAHRYMYELVVGPIPAGLDLDHLCCNPPCVNPLHLEAVTRAVNIKRGWQSRTDGFCPHGHPPSERTKNKNRNYCLACLRMRRLQMKEAAL